MCLSLFLSLLHPSPQIKESTLYIFMCLNKIESNQVCNSPGSAETVHFQVCSLSLNRLKAYPRQLQIAWSFCPRSSLCNFWKLYEKQAVLVQFLRTLEVGWKHAFSCVISGGCAHLISEWPLQPLQIVKGHMHSFKNRHCWGFVSPKTTCHRFAITVIKQLVYHIFSQCQTTGQHILLWDTHSSIWRMLWYPSPVKISSGLNIHNSFNHPSYHLELGFQTNDHTYCLLFLYNSSSLSQFFQKCGSQSTTQHSNGV